MDEKKYLNEEKYQKAEKKITFLAVIVLVLALCLGGFLIYRGVAKPGTSKISELKEVLESKKKDLEDKGVQYNPSAKYDDGEAYELKIITEALDPSFNHCAFDEFKNNDITREYCAAKNSTSQFATSSSIMFGAFICFAGLIISGSIFSIAKRRKILAFTAQQVMPVAKEGIDEMAPTIGDAAEKITRGIKKGLDDRK